MWSPFLASVTAAALLCGVAVQRPAQAASLSSVPTDKEIVVVFRYDDFSARSEQTGFEMALVKELTRRKIPCTFGVIPYVCDGNVHDPSPQHVLPLDSKRAATLKDAVAEGIIEVAQHGFNHQTLAGQPKQGWTEFVGRPLQDQVERIRKGKELLGTLFGREPETFIPPWNSYDAATLEAARICGFRVFSGDCQGPARRSPLQFVPSTTDPRDLKRVCKLAMSNSDPQPVIVVLIHEYDFREMDPVGGYLTLGQFSELLDWVVSNSALRTTTLGRVKAADASRYLALQSLQRARNILPSSLLRLLALDWPVGTYPSLETITHFRRVFQAMILPLYLGLFCLAAGVGWLLRSRSSGRLVFAALVVVLVSATILLSFSAASMTAKHLCLLVALAGINVGWWMNTWKMFGWAFRPKAGERTPKVFAILP